LTTKLSKVTHRTTKR